MAPTIETVAVVPSRSGSKGMIGKNFSLFAGQPLFMHAINQGLRTCNRCVFSTDNARALKTVANTKHLRAHRRNRRLAGDNSPIVESIIAIIKDESLFGATIVLLQPTSPLRTDQSIIQALETYKTGKFDLVMGVSAADSAVLKSGFLHDGHFVPMNNPEFCFMNRQQLPKVYKPNGTVFVFNGSWLLSNKSLVSNKMGYVEISAEECVDIDTTKDFMKAEKIFLERNNQMSGK